MTHVSHLPPLQNVFYKLIACDELVENAQRRYSVPDSSFRQGESLQVHRKLSEPGVTGHRFCRSQNYGVRRARARGGTELAADSAERILVGSASSMRLEPQCIDDRDTNARTPLGLAGRRVSTADRPRAHLYTVRSRRTPRRSPPRKPRPERRNTENVRQTSNYDTTSHYTECSWDRRDVETVGVNERGTGKLVRLPVARTELATNRNCVFS